MKLMIKNNTKLLNSEKGATAIFVVVFFALLIGVIVLSFTRIAVQDQQQAAISDLSQSAFDSAEAGIEDGVRILQNYRKECLALPLGEAAPPQCATYETQFTAGAAGSCNLHNMPGINEEPSGEVKVSTNAGDQALDQAYTCVKIIPDTNDYKQEAEGDKNYLIALKTVNNVPIISIEFNWFSDTELNGAPVTFHAPVKELPLKPNWGSTTPPVMRVQLIPVKRGAGEVNVTSINNDSRAIFLFPTNSGAASTSVDMNLADQPRTRKSTGPDVTPHPIRCVHTNIFNCSARLTNLPPATFAGAADTDYFLRVSPKYGNSHFQIILRDALGGVIKFDNIEPEIDSTGRANSLFQRIQQRIVYETPDTGDFDITRGVCKDFQISDKDVDYQANCSDSALVNP